MIYIKIFQLNREKNTIMYLHNKYNMEKKYLFKNRNI